MARRLQWNDEGQSVNSRGEPDGDQVEIRYMDGDREVVEQVRRGRFQISSIVNVSTGRTEWFLADGPLDQAPDPCESLEEAKALAQAIVDGPQALGEFESKRAASKAVALRDRRAQAKRESFAALLDDDDFVEQLRTKLDAGRA